MVTLLFRFLSLVLIICGLMLLGADAVSTLKAGGVIKLRSLESVWMLFVPGSAPSAALPGPLAMILGIPAWAVLGLLGLLFAFLFRHRDDEYDH